MGEHLGEKAENALLAVAAVLGGLLAILLFTVLPTFLVGGVDHFVALGRWGKVVLEALLKVGIFLAYMVGISNMKEIHRVFEYHVPSTRPLPATRRATSSPWRMCASTPASTRAAAPAF